MSVSRVNVFFIVAFLITVGYCQDQRLCGGKPGIPPPESQCCGRDYADEDRIIGGKETELEQFPWTVLLETTFTNGTSTAAFNCGGALISSRYILTAAHCVAQKDARVDRIQVNLSEYDKRTFPLDCVTTAEEGRRCIQNRIVFAETVTRHPDYDNMGLLNDIAVIRLEVDVPYTQTIRPICLPSADIDNPQFTKYNLIVAGWGQDGPYNSDVKQSTSVHLVPQNSCKNYYASLTRRHLCAGSLTGKDTCQGDSGGPLMMVYEGKHYVVGIVSGKRADVPCGASVPSLYTNVFHYVDWIRENVRN